MNNETEKNINQALDWLQKTGGAIQDFAVEQAPLYCREVIAWQLAASIAVMIFGLISLFTALAFFRKGVAVQKNNEGKSYSHTEDPFGWFFFASLFAALAVSLVFMGSITALKAHVAPRVVVVEHLQRLK